MSLFNNNDITPFSILPPGIWKCWLINRSSVLHTILYTVWLVYYIYMAYSHIYMRTSHQQPPEVFYKKRCSSKNAKKFTGKHLCQSLFFNNVAGQLFYKTSLDDCFWNTFRQRIIKLIIIYWMYVRRSYDL